MKLLKTNKDYQSAIKRLGEIFQAKAGTKESDESDILALLIKDYEERHFILEVPTPIEAIQYRMEQKGLPQEELAQILEYNGQITDIFKKKHKLDLPMIRKIHKNLQIPLEILIKEY